jgi:hypothetical protein
MPDRPLRDPFAKPGDPGNRSMGYGSDGPIPGKYKGLVNHNNARSRMVRSSRLLHKTHRISGGRAKLDQAADSRFHSG